MTTPLVIVLVGMMGSGKTTVGLSLAKTLSLPFIDTDTQITENTQQSITSLFQTEGETVFRAIERRTIMEVMETVSSCIISLGGGAFMDTQIRTLLQQKAFSIWLRARVETLLSRLSDPNTYPRPLLMHDDPNTTLSQLLTQREPYYAQTNLSIDTDSLTCQDIVTKICSFLEASYPLKYSLNHS